MTPRDPPRGYEGLLYVGTLMVETMARTRMVGYI